VLGCGATVYRPTVWQEMRSVKDEAVLGCGATVYRPTVRQETHSVEDEAVLGCGAKKGLHLICCELATK